MFVVEIFLPMTDNQGGPFALKFYEAERKTLVAKFGGVTIYSRSPAAGFWAAGEETIEDKIVIFEVLVESLDRAWWGDYRNRLQSVFRQDTILIRAVNATTL